MTIRKSFKFTNIFITLVKFPSSGGIGPVNWFTPKSKTLRFFNKPISFGIVPISEFPCKILQSPGYQNNKQMRQITESNMELQSKRLLTVLARKLNDAIPMR